MKFLLSVAAIIAVASAIPAKRSVVSPMPARSAMLVDENNNQLPLDPTSSMASMTSSLLISPLLVLLLPPIFPSPVVTPVTPVSPVSPVAPAPASSAPLVQLIVNVNAPAPVAAAPEPINIVDLTPVVDPVQIVDTPVVVEPVQIVDQVVEPVQIVDTPVVVEPVQIVDVAPVVVEPVQIGAPIIPAPAVNLPDELN